MDFEKGSMAAFKTLFPDGPAEVGDNHPLPYTVQLRECNFYFCQAIYRHFANTNRFFMAY